MYLYNLYNQGFVLQTLSRANAFMPYKMGPNFGLIKTRWPPFHLNIDFVLLVNTNHLKLPNDLI